MELFCDVAYSRLKNFRAGLDLVRG